MHTIRKRIFCALTAVALLAAGSAGLLFWADGQLSLIHISEPTRH